nr:penicillin-binding protein 1A [Salmonella sp. NCTC 7297]
MINTPLAFLIKSALNTNIFGEPGWMGTGWRAARDLKRRDIGGKTGTTKQLERRMVLRLWSWRRHIRMDRL